MPVRAAVIAGLALALPTAGASGHGGLVLTASGTANVDGVIDPAEWGTARPIDFAATIPAADGGGAAPARLLVMNDERNLYLAVRVERADTRFVTASFAFDADHDGTYENGDDHVSAFTGAGVSASFDDGHRLACGGAGPCTVDDDALRGGTTDGRAASTTQGGVTSIELEHPLDSPDDAHDFSLAPGAVVGLAHVVRLTTSTPCVGGEGCAADSVTVRGEVALSPLAHLAVVQTAPRRVVAGRIATYTLRVANPGGGTAFDARLSDELPRGARVLAVTTTQGTCTRRATLVACRLGAIRPFATATVGIRARLTRVGRAVNHATVQSVSYDEITANNHARATTQVVRR